MARWLHLVAAPQIGHQQVVTWTSMINACANCQPRRGVAAQKVFQQMLQSGVQPNKAGQVQVQGITVSSWFLSVLSSSYLMILMVSPVFL